MEKSDKHQTPKRYRHFCRIPLSFRDAKSSGFTTAPKREGVLFIIWRHLLHNLSSDGFIRTIIHGIGIEVYGVLPKITINRVPDGVVIIWKGGVLQSVKNIDGPWIDVTVGGPRFLFLRSTLPAKFFPSGGSPQKEGAQP